MNDLDQQISDTAKLEWGVKQVRKGEAPALRMKCFNRQEVETLQIYMARNHPDVVVFWEWLAPQPGGREVTGETC